LRFHSWRHSQSVPLRWRRAVALAAGVAQAVQQVARAAPPEARATRAAREAVRVAPALLNPPAAWAKAVRPAIALLNPPAAPARTASIPQGRELGRGALPTLQAERPALPDSDKRSARATPTFHGRALAQVTRSVSAGALPLFQCGLTCRVGSARQSHGQSHQWPIGRKNHSSTPN
jgi:hypothetical protein